MNLGDKLADILILLGVKGAEIFSFMSDGLSRLSPSQMVEHHPVFPHIGPGSVEDGPVFSDNVLLLGQVGQKREGRFVDSLGRIVVLPSGSAGHRGGGHSFGGQKRLQFFDLGSGQQLFPALVLSRFR